MYSCMYVCNGRYVRINICIHVRTYMHEYVCMFVCMYVCIDMMYMTVCMCVHNASFARECMMRTSAFHRQN